MNEKIPIWSSDRRAVWLISINKGRRFQSGTNLRWIDAGALSILVILSWEKNSSILCGSLCTMGFGDVELRTLCSDFLVTSWPSRTHSDLCTGSSKGHKARHVNDPISSKLILCFLRHVKCHYFLPDWSQYYHDMKSLATIYSQWGTKKRKVRKVFLFVHVTS